VTDPELEGFSVDVSSLIEVLSGHLYTTPEVAIRELIANARDAIVRRRRAEGDIEGGIWIGVDRRENVLAIRDNGAGMSEDEIRAGLSTIAASGARAVRDWQDSGGLDEALSGLFGLGFYASLIWADRIEVFTRTAAGPLFRWQCVKTPFQPEEKTAIGWGLQEVPDVEASWVGCGTEVRLHLAARERNPLADSEELRKLLLRYAALVEFPIYLGEEFQPLNPPPPWRSRQATDEDYLDFVRRRGLLSDTDDPITIFPISAIGLEGLLWITPRRDGEIELHVRHILVGPLQDADTDEPFPFVHGIVDAREIDLALNREAALDNENLAALHAALRRATIDHLSWLSQNRRADFQRIVDAHEFALKKACLEEDRLLGIVGDSLRLAVGGSRTMMSLRDIANHARGHGGVLYFLDQPAEQTHYASLYEGKGIPVVDASNPLDLAVVRRYAEAEGLEFERADTGLTELVEPGGEPGWGEVEHLFASIDAQLQPRAVSLQPTDPPLLFEHSSLEAFVGMIDQIGGVPEEMQGLELLLEAMRDRAKEEARPLLINAGHPVMQALRRALDSGEDYGRVVAAGRGLLAAARLFSETLDAGERRDALEQLADLVSALLR